MLKKYSNVLPIKMAGALLIAVAALGLTLSTAQAETKKYGGHWVGSNGGHGKFGRKVTREPGFRSSTTKAQSHNGRTYTNKRRTTWDREAGTYASGRKTVWPNGTTTGTKRRATRGDDGSYFVEGRHLKRNGEVVGWSGTFTPDGQYRY
ncbi:MAG: hypothetical protein GY791_13895 [Alphaproteobacteria bacterium]|nr:hypothetical protein [Alphaproteobacteria bacterium]